MLKGVFMQLIFIIDTYGNIQYKNDLAESIKQIFVTKETEIKKLFLSDFENEKKIKQELPRLINSNVKLKYNLSILVPPVCEVYLLRY
jgi:predicted nuclease of restriction endonuclease-like RecB superfamily